MYEYDDDDAADDSIEVKRLEVMLHDWEHTPQRGPLPRPLYEAIMGTDGVPPEVGNHLAGQIGEGHGHPKDIFEAAAEAALAYEDPDGWREVGHYIDECAHDPESAETAREG